jgi:cytochrome bd-type quinol oxidase subunit 2
MEIKTFLDARFLAPSTIAVFFVFLANPEKFSSYIAYHEFGFLLGFVFVFGIGFLISSLMTGLFIEPFKIRQTLSNESIKRLSVLFPYLKRGDCFTKTEKELAIWLAIEDDKSKYIREQLHKRWHAFNASANSILALVLALVSIYYFNVGIVFKSFWWPLFGASFIAFAITACTTYKSVKEIDNIIIHRLGDDKRSAEIHKDG